MVEGNTEYTDGGRVSSKDLRPAEVDGTDRKILSLLKADPEVRKHLSEKELTANFDLDFHLAQVDTIFARVFGSP